LPVFFATTGRLLRESYSLLAFWSCLALTDSAF